MSGSIAAEWQRHISFENHKYLKRLKKEHAINSFATIWNISDQLLGIHTYRWSSKDASNFTFIALDIQH